MPVERIISGGQAGVDRAALDVALERGLPCGGWCPRGRKAEDGAIADRYPLQQTPSERYAERTEWNVRDSDGTLVLTVGEPTGGTAFTIKAAAVHRRPLLLVDLEESPDPTSVVKWIERHEIRVLNIAGPRESTVSGIYDRARDFLRKLMPLAAINGDQR